MPLITRKKKGRSRVFLYEMGESVQNDAERQVRIGQRGRLVRGVA